MYSKIADKKKVQATLSKKEPCPSWNNTLDNKIADNNLQNLTGCKEGELPHPNTGAGTTLGWLRGGGLVSLPQICKTLGWLCIRGAWQRPGEEVTAARWRRPGIDGEEATRHRW
jgi:hypothetical protein